MYDKGSTAAITRQLHRALLDRGDDSLVLYGRGAVSQESGARKIVPELYAKANHLRADLNGLMYGGCELATAHLCAALQREAPDVVHLQCINGYFVNIPRLIAFLKERAIPTLITLHAEFMYTANCSHAFDCERWRGGCGSCPDRRRQTHSLFRDASAVSWQRMAAAFDGFKKLTVVSVSPWQRMRAEASPFFQDARHVTIGNGVDTSVFTPREKIMHERPRILHVTPHFTDEAGHIKGGEYVVCLAEALGERAEIRVVGPGRAERAPENVRFLGPVWDTKKLAELYADADLTLLTSRRETFSMVCAESMCCGTPVVGFKAGGPESIALPAYSAFVPWGDVDALRDACLSILDSSEKVTELAREAAWHYSNERMIREYFIEYEKARVQS